MRVGPIVLMYQDKADKTSIGTHPHQFLGCSSGKDLWAAVSQSGRHHCLHSATSAVRPQSEYRFGGKSRPEHRESSIGSGSIRTGPPVRTLFGTFPVLTANAPPGGGDSEPGTRSHTRFG